MIAVRLPPEIEQRIAALSARTARTGRTKTFYIEQAILEHLDELEDEYLALDRLEKPAKRWTLDEMEQGLDKAVSR